MAARSALIQIRASEDEARQLERLAAARGVTKSKVIRTLIAEALQQKNDGRARSHNPRPKA